MSDAYCQKHFITYCPELSEGCPYCCIAELEHRHKRDLAEYNRVSKELTELEEYIQYYREGVRYEQAKAIIEESRNE